MKISLFVKFFINDLVNLNLGQESQRFSPGQDTKISKGAVETPLKFWLPEDLGDVLAEIA